MATLTFRPPYTTAAGAYGPHFIASSLEFLNGA
jgi:hypothetical protein